MTVCGHSCVCSMLFKAVQVSTPLGVVTHLLGLGWQPLVNSCANFTNNCPNSTKDCCLLWTLPNSTHTSFKASCFLNSSTGHETVDSYFSNKSTKFTTDPSRMLLLNSTVTFCNSAAFCSVDSFRPWRTSTASARLLSNFAPASSAASKSLAFCKSAGQAAQHCHSCRTSQGFCFSWSWDHSSKSGFQFSLSNRGFKIP